MTSGRAWITTATRASTPITPSGQDLASRYSNLHLIIEPPSLPSPGAWVLTAAHFLNAYKLTQQHNAAACLLLGAEAQSLSPEALRSLANAVAGVGAGGAPTWPFHATILGRATDW